MTHESPRISPALGISIGVAAVSTAAIFIRFARAEGAPSLVIAAWRLALAALLLAILGLWRHRPELRRLTRREAGLAVVSGIFLGIHFATWITSLDFTTVANSVVLVSTAPLFVAGLAALVLRERLGRTGLAGMIVALAGGVVVGLSDACSTGGCPPLTALLNRQSFAGDVLALAGAATVAVYLLIGRTLRATMSLTVYILLTYGTAALTLIAAALIAGLPLTGYSPAAYGWLILLAAIPQLIGHSAYNWALRYLPATFVAVTVLGEPIGSALLAYFILGETPSALKIAGGGLILGGILIAARRAR